MPSIAGAYKQGEQHSCCLGPPRTSAAHLAFTSPHAREKAQLISSLYKFHCRLSRDLWTQGPEIFCAQAADLQDREVSATAFFAPDFMAL